MKHPALLLISVLLLLVVVACFPCIYTPRHEMDPARLAEDPSAFLGDDWDRRAASRIDDERGTDLESLVSRHGTEREVVDALRAITAAPGVLLVRRAKAAYAAAADAMASEDKASRSWGLAAFVAVEARYGGRPSSDPPGPQYEGPERDAAIAGLARILTSDPEYELRKEAALLMWQWLPHHDEPTPEAIAAALAREEQDQTRTRLLWLLAERRAPAPLILEAAMHGYRDPVDVSVGIHDLFVEENRELIEQAYAEGDAVGRAGIGETFYRHQTPMPWAEALFLRGLSDPDPEVRARFAKGTMVLRPFSAAVRARLQAMAAEEPNAVWALTVEAEEE